MSNIIIVPRAQELEQSDIFAGTWLELSEVYSATPIYRMKDGEEYLLIVCEEGEAEGTSAEVIAYEDYHEYGFEIVEGDTLFPTREGGNEGRERG